MRRITRKQLRRFILSEIRLHENDPTPPESDITKLKKLVSPIVGVSEMEKDFIKFLDHFQVDSIQYFGKTSQNFKDTIESFGFPISYKTLISGYSK